MRKNILGALVASAFAFGGAAHAGLVLDLNGTAAGGQITADALDWAPTSFLARGGNAAISNFVSSGGACASVNCSFEVLTHARLSGYSPSAGGGFIGLPSGVGEITLVSRYTETVVNASGGSFPTAQFVSTGAGSLEFYYSSAIDSTDLTGAGFNNGRLIGRLTGVTVGAFGSFTVTGGAQDIDQTTDGNQYSGQLSVRGTGSQDTLIGGTVASDLDPTFFATALKDFSINFQNISIGLPFSSSNPSDCFNDPIAGRIVGANVNNASTCNATHVNGLYAAQSSSDPGYLPNVGSVNGLGLGSPDFVAQTDFNSSVRGTVPEPGSLALMGLALGALSFFGARRRRS